MVMQTYTVSIFGHRRIYDFRKLGEELENMAKEVLESFEFVEFLVGRNGDFDEYAASVIKRVQKNMGSERCCLTLVLPYKLTDIEYYRAYYDSVVIPDELYGVYYKAAITERNRYMIDKSDLVVAWCVRSEGGVYNAVKYAQSKGMPIKKIGTE